MVAWNLISLIRRNKKKSPANKFLKKKNVEELAYNYAVNNDKIYINK